MEIEAALKVVARSHGFTSLKDKQKEAVTSFASGKDVFVALPTGYGKSLCYQGLPCLFDTLLKHEVPSCIVVVVTSLVAIMKDQVSDLTERHIRAVFVTTDLEESVETAVLNGKFSIVYISPELLLRQVKWREMLRSSVFQKNLVGFVIDEAHCVKKW